VVKHQKASHCGLNLLEGHAELSWHGEPV